MTSLRRDIGWDLKDEEDNWKSWARAHQRLAGIEFVEFSIQGRSRAAQAAWIR